MIVLRTSSRSRKPVVLFYYEQTRSGEILKAILEEFATGYIQSDGLNIYQDLPRIINAGCWQHARRPFTDLLKTLPADKRDGADAAVAVRLIDRLFVLEAGYVDMTAEQRHKARLELSKPVAEEFFEWAGSREVLPKSQMGKGVSYALNQKEFLMNIFLDGRLELSNNLTENSIRPFVVGRKNWTFANTPRGADASAIIYSIIETAKASNLVPYTYLKHVMERMSSRQFTTSMCPELLPWNPALPDECRFNPSTFMGGTISDPLTTPFKEDPDTS
jgi:hypothetical protein